MKLDGELPYYPIHEHPSGIIQHDNLAMPDVLKAGYEPATEVKQSLISPIGRQRVNETKTPQHSNGSVPHSFVEIGDSANGNWNEGAQIEAPYDAPVPNIKVFDKSRDFCTDKIITELEFSDKVVCFKDVACHVIKDICVDDGAHSPEKILVETDDKDGKNCFSRNCFDEGDEENPFIQGHVSSCGNDDVTRDLLNSALPIPNDLQISSTKGPPLSSVDTDDAGQCSPGKLLESGDKLDPNNRITSNFCAEKLSVDHPLSVVGKDDMEPCSLGTLLEGGEGLDLSNQTPMTRDLLNSALPIPNDLQISSTKGRPLSSVDTDDAGQCSPGKPLESGDKLDPNNRITSNFCAEKLSVDHPLSVVSKDDTEPCSFGTLLEGGEGLNLSNQIPMTRDLLNSALSIPNDLQISSTKEPPLSSVDKDDAGQCSLGKFLESGDKLDPNNRITSNFCAEKLSVDHPLSVVSKDDMEPCSFGTLLEGGGELDLSNKIVTDFSSKELSPKQAPPLQELEMNLVEVDSSGFHSSNDQMQLSELHKESDQVKPEEGDPLPNASASAVNESNKSNEAEEHLADLKVESGVITFTFDSGAASASDQCESKGSADSQQFGQALNDPRTEETSADDATASARSSFVHQSQGEQGFPGPASLSGRIAFSGHIPYSGSISLRSDSSTTSTRSFAFPILQSDWNSSPVKMAKADRRHLRKHRGWRMRLVCCRF